MYRTHGRRFLPITVLRLLLAAIVALPLHAAAGENTSGPDEASNLLRCLGIAGLKCRCSYTPRSESAEPLWLFHSEPGITRVDPDGPARDKLRRGDVIVAIDGLFITTRRAGQRFARLSPGDQVELTVRREGHLIGERLVLEPPDEGVPPRIEGLRFAPSERETHLSQVMEALARIAPELPEHIRRTAEEENVLGLRDLLTPSKLKSLSTKLLPSGWFGFSLSFRGTVEPEGATDGQSRWRFDLNPRVRSVAEDGPAARAGLKPGDVLTHIDGVRLDTDEGGARFSAVKPGQAVTWDFLRDGSRRTVEIVAEERPASADAGRPPSGWILEGDSGQEAPRGEDAALFSPTYYEELKASGPDRKKGTSWLAKIFAGEQRMNLTVTDIDGTKTSHRYRNSKWAIEGAIRSVGEERIVLERLTLYDPEDDFELEARNMVLNPDGGLGGGVDVSGDGSLTLTKKVDDANLEYRIERWSLDSGYGRKREFFVDGERFPFREKQQRECRYLLSKAYAILQNNFITFSSILGR